MSNDSQVQAEQGMAASRVVACIEHLWTAIQKQHKDVPAVVVTFGAGSIGTRRGELRLGHFAASRWQQEDGTVLCELFVGGEGLARGAVEVTGTLLHEAAHALAFARGIKDTSRQGRYHNTRFKAIAESMGLVITQAPGIGWSSTHIPTETADIYAEEVIALARAIRAYRSIEGGGVLVGPDGDGQGDGTGEGGADEGDKPAPKNGYALTCGCKEPRKVRASRAVALAGPILCGLCGQPFTHPDLTDDQTEAGRA